LPLHSLKFYFCVFGRQHLVFEITLGLEKLSSGVSVVFLLCFILFNPAFSSFFL
jgi:hypothetical protein